MSEYKLKTPRQVEQGFVDRFLEKVDGSDERDAGQTGKEDA